MKREFSILIGIITLIIGIATYYFYPYFIPVSLCEVSENAKYYESKTVRIKLSLMAGRNYDEISPALIVDSINNCRTKGNVIISEELKHNEEFLKLQKELVWGRFEEDTHTVGQMKITDIELIGELINVKKSIIVGEKPKFTFKATKFKQLSEVRQISKDEFEKKYYSLSDF